MGNIGSISNRQRNRNGNHNRNPSPPSHSLSPSPQLGINGNIYVFASATPYPTQFSNSNPLQYYQNSNYYHPSPMSMPLPPADAVHANWMNRCPCGPTPHSPAPYVEHQKAVTIKSDVNLKKETLRVEPDEQNPGRFLVAFTFDATVARRREQRIAYVFFTKNGHFYIFDFMVYLGCIKILLLVSFYRIICYNGCFLRVLVSIYLVSPCICWLAILAW